MSGADLRGAVLRRTPALVALAGVLLVAAGAYLTHRMIERERALAVRAVEQDAASLARTYEEHVFQVVRRLDQALAHLRDEYEHSPEAFMAKAMWRSPLLTDLAFQVVGAGPSGALLFSSQKTDPSALNFADRDYFRFHRDNDDDALHISKPLVGRISGKLTVQFTRRLRNFADGAFNGALVLSVEPARLASYFGPDEVGREGAVMLVGLDRVVRARSSSVAAPRQPVGSIVPNTPMFDPAQPAAGVYHMVSPIDGVARVTAYRRLANYPLIAVVSLGEAEAMAGFEEHRRTAIATAVQVSVVVLGAMFLLAWLAHQQVRQQRRLEAAQSQVARAEERLRLALEAVGDGVWDWDAATDETFLSTGWKGMLGFADAELPNRGEEWRSRIHPDDRNVIRHDTASRFYAHTYRVRCKDGSDKWILDRGAVLARDAAGAPLRAIGTLTDVTERHRAEDTLKRQAAELERSNAELEAFAYVASHDLRQPLRTINSYLGLLEKDLDGRLDDENREYITFARDGAQRMDRLIVDLLEYSRVGRKAKPFEMQPTAEIVAAALRNLEVAIAEAGAAISVEAGLPAVWGDRNELERLFQNLIGNAVKYRAADRAPAIHMACAADGDVWHFTVRDNGIGIAPQHFERIFGIFQRLHGRDAYEGTGLGLALCRKIVEHHGGRIWVTSDADAGAPGSVFHVTLPRREAPAA